MARVGILLRGGPIHPLAAMPEEVREMRCLLTMVAGEIVHPDGGA